MPGTRFKVSNEKGRKPMPPSQLTLSLDNSKECEYHQQFPHIYKAFEKLTLRTIKKGFQNYSAKGILELVRWNTGISAGSNDVFKVNNNYSSFYARLFEKDHPDHAGFFRTRKSRFD